MDHNNLIILFINQFYIFIIIIIILILGYISITQLILGYIILCILIHFTSFSYLYYNKNNELIKSILKKSPSITSLNYTPPFLFPINPLQLINLSRSKVKLTNKIIINRQNISSNGLSIDWISYEEINNINGPILIILPGLTGSVNDAYVINLADKAIKEGFIVCIYQMRLLNENVKLPKKKYLFLMDDLDLTINEINKKFNNEKEIFAVGFSYGANQIVRYLGEYNYLNKKISGAVSISNPYEMIITSRFGKDKLYDRMLLMFCQEVFIKTRKSLEKDIELNLNCDLIQNTNSLYVFDTEYTAKVFGFDNASDYYRNVGCAKFIKNINVPLLCINSLDDQVTVKYAIPYDSIQQNNFVVLLTTTHGTHSCFLEDSGFFHVRQWVSIPSIEFLNAIRNIRNVKFY